MHPSACQICNGESLHEHPDMDDLIETAIANIDALEKEMERWIVIGETHQALAISNQMVTTDIANLLGSSLVQGFWQPVAFGTKTESCFDTARVGALHVRLDEIEDTLVNTGILLRKTKRAKQEANMEARDMLLGRAAGPSGASLMIPFLNGGSPGASTSGSLNTARYPPSLPPPPHASSNASSEPLVLPGVVSSLDPGTMHSERSTKRLATLSKSALSSLVPLLCHHLLCQLAAKWCTPKNGADGDGADAGEANTHRGNAEISNQATVTLDTVARSNLKCRCTEDALPRADSQMTKVVEYLNLLAFGMGRLGAPAEG